jgi:hypothetical protein
MQPEEIEEMLYHRAVHSKVRPPMVQRISNLAYNRVVTGGVVAGAALVCTLAMTSSGASSSSTSDRRYTGQTHPQLTETGPKRQPEYPAPIAPDNINAVTASLAMSRVGN